MNDKCPYEKLRKENTRLKAKLKGLKNKKGKEKIGLGLAIRKIFSKNIKLISIILEDEECRESTGR